MAQGPASADPVGLLSQFSKRINPADDESVHEIQDLLTAILVELRVHSTLLVVGLNVKDRVDLLRLDEIKDMEIKPSGS